MKIIRLEKKYLVMLFAVLTMTLLSSVSFAASYYVDSVGGNDSNPGTVAQPWRTVAKVKGTALIAGDIVCFKCGGIWNELLYPASGVSGKDVMYDAYGTGNKPSIRGFYADNKSYVKVQNIEFKNNSTDIPFLIYNGSHHISVYNCTITADTACTSYSALWLSKNVSYNRISNCTITHNNINRQTDVINLRLNANYNVIQNNTISGATHYCLALEGNTDIYPSYTCNNNIILNNKINAKNGAGIALISGSHNNVVDGNTVTGGKSTSFDVNLPRSLKVTTKNNIVRRNIIRDNIDPNSSGISTEVYAYGSYPANVATNNHIYNNTIYNVTKYPIVIATDKSTGAAAYKNYYKNNVVYGDYYNTYQVTIMVHPAIYDNYFSNNLLYSSGSPNVLAVPIGSYFSVAQIQSNDPAHFYDNLQITPQLDSILQPQSGSPCVDKGAFLTTVTSSSGAGTLFTVTDASYFYDGYGLLAGDTIMVGGAVATIASINYVTNTITLTTPISWIKGANVSLPYGGSRPDVGAYEVSSTVTASLAPPSNLRVID